MPTLANRGHGLDKMIQSVLVNPDRQEIVICYFWVMARWALHVGHVIEDRIVIDKPGI